MAYRILAAIALGSVFGCNSAKTECIRATALETRVYADRLARIDAGIDGDLGSCVGVADRLSCIHADEPFKLQSVMKVLVAVAALRAVDAGEMALDDPVTLTARDVSIGIQPMAEEVARRQSLTVPLRDLIERMITQSDSMATDVLIGRLGGTRAVQAMLTRIGVSGVRIDRTERQLQTEPYGLSADMRWQGMDDYERRLSVRRLADVPSAGSDPRDTATPRGLAVFLAKAIDGSILSPASVRTLLGMMARTRTFPDRLKAAAPDGWQVAHKTGTSRTLNEVTETTNDAGYMIAPGGARVIAVALLANSRASARDRAAAIASVGTAAIAFFRADAATAASSCLRGKVN